MSVEEQFQAGSEHFKEIHENFTNREQLRLYGLWSQATHGDNTGKTPSKTNLRKYYKHLAWERCKGMSKETAMKRYVSELRSIDQTWVPPGGTNVTKKKTSKGKGKDAKGNGKGKQKPKKTGEALRKEFQKAADFAFVSDRFKQSNQRSLLYAYYKQATEGSCRRAAPSVFAGRQKYSNWRSWVNLFDMDKEEAMQKYVEQVHKIAPEFDFTDKGAEDLLEQERINDPDVDDDERVKLASKTDAKSLSKRMKATSEDGGTIYFLSGATGFIGKHLMDRLFARNPNSLMICVTRDGSNVKLASEALERGYISQIAPIVGDISKKNFAIPADILKVLTSGGKEAGDGVSHFFHLAASYDLTASEEVNSKLNVDGTRYAYKLSEAMQAKFEYVSSIVVSGDYNGVFLESHFEEGQDFYNPYAKTKYLAEKLVREECKARYRIYRPGIVVGHSVTGEADKIDGPYYFFKPLQQLRKFVPRAVVLPCIEGEVMPIVPVDYVVEAMDEIAHNSDEELDSRAFHLVDSSPPVFIDTLNIFAKAANAPTFSSRLPKILEAVLPRKAVGTASTIPLIGGAPHFLAKNVLGIPEANIDYIQFRTEYDDADTQEVLAGTGIRCPKLKDYAWRLWDYYERHMDRSLNKPKALRKEIRGKNIVVTGASDGIGKQLSFRLAKAGANVILIARNKDKLAAVQKEILDQGGKCEFFIADLAKGDSTDKMIDDVLKSHDKIDILVNNAGRSIRRSVEYQFKGTGRFHDFERCINLNFYGSLRCMLGFLPKMAERNEGQIINISTIGAMTHVPRFGAYVASKSALDGFTKCIAGELATSNVVLTTVYMPLVKTKMVVSKGSKKGSDFQDLITTDEAAAMIERAMVTKERQVATATGNFVSATRFFFPSLIESIMNFIYQLEPEKAPEGQDDSKTASGDLEQLRAIKMLMKGAL